MSRRADVTLARALREIRDLSGALLARPANLAELAKFTADAELLASSALTLYELDPAPVKP